MNLINRISTIPNPFQERRLPSVQIALDGQPIYLRNFKATASMVREESDMSGQESSTKKAEQGVKAKKLKVSGVIPYHDVDWLQTLMSLAEAVDEKQEQKKYRIANKTAEAINMREGVFSGELLVSESMNQLAWEVSFELAEVNSVSEKKAQRAKKPQAKVQSEKSATSSGQGGGFFEKLDKKNKDLA